MDEAPKSYRERQKEARRAASAQRRAEKEAWQRAVALRVECQRMALQLVKDEIRARGQKVTDFEVKELRQHAEEYIGPWLVAKAQARVEQILQVMSKSERPGPQAVSMHRTRAQNGVAR